MGTRGCYGFRFNNTDKLTYNHYDSYPDYLGANIVEFIKLHDVEKLKEFCNAIQLVNNSDPVPADAAAQYEETTDLGVSTGSNTEWYCVLRKTQGDLDKLFQFWQRGVTPYMIDNQEFMTDSLFCEYAYIINLDDETLEFYTGFQRKPQPGNRYGEEACDGYYPCALRAVYPLSCYEEMLDSMCAIAQNDDYTDDYTLGEDNDMQQKIIDAAEELGWTVRFRTDGGETTVCFSNSSPAGEDLELEYQYSDIDDLVHDLHSNYDDFDMSYHVYEWLEARYRHHMSTPDASDLVADADEIERMYYDLWNAISNIK